MCLHLRLCLITLLLFHFPFFSLKSMANPITWIEDFALAEQREPILAQLTPGTEDYFYYQALHAQNQQAYAQVDTLLTQWQQAYGSTARWQEIKNRQVLLRYPQQPAASLRYLQDYLGVQFHHQPVLDSGATQMATLPSQLDPGLLARKTLLAKALSFNGSLERLEDRAFYWLDSEELTPAQRQEWLQRLPYPDHSDLVRRIHEALQREEYPSFGALPIHQQLLQEQMDELAQLQPTLLQESNFVQQYMLRLLPATGVDITQDRAEYQRYLQRLWVFLSPLSAHFNALKAQVLYYQLRNDQQQGIYDWQRFIRYLQLPREVNYQPATTLQRANLQQTAIPGLPAIGEDEPLVRDYLQYFLRQADATARQQAYQQVSRYLTSDYLKMVDAETRLLYGIGKPEAAAAFLSPEAYQTLKARVDLEFLPTNPVFFQRQDPVKLTLWIKNVPQLRVKIYKINAEKYYQQYQRELNTDINLDGLVPHQAYQYTYTQAPLQRFQQSFTFAELPPAGTFIIDFMGNGKSSRALIRKGQLYYQTAPQAQGQWVRVFDEQHQPVPQAQLWLSGQHYTADDKGEVLLPYSNNARQEHLVLRHGEVASLATFANLGEAYQLEAGFYVEREMLLPGTEAVLLIRPQLSLNGVAVDLEQVAIEEAQLHLTTMDQAGVTQRQLVPLVLTAENDLEYRFRVPERLQQLQTKLTLRIKPHAQNQPLTLSAEQTFHLNQVMRQASLDSVYLRRVEGQYQLDMRGLNGEARPYQALTLTLKHQDFRDPIIVTLQTDAQGQIALGPLSGIETIKTQFNAAPHQPSQHWVLPQDRVRWQSVRYGQAGKPLDIPYPVPITTLSRADFALFASRQGDLSTVLSSDYFDRLQVQDGRLQVQGLPVGHYTLVLKAFDQVIQLQIEPVLTTAISEPLQWGQVALQAQQLRIQLVNSHPTTRVHIWASRYLPEYDPFTRLQRGSFAPPLLNRAVPTLSQYVVGRDLGDEYRYILDRADYPAHAGNLLQRPGLLLNPWAITQTATERQLTLAGDAGFAPSEPAPTFSLSAPSTQKAAATLWDQPATGQHWASYDFMAQPGMAWLNLTPDTQGRLDITFPAQTPPHLHLLAVEGNELLYQQVVLADTPLQTQDLRLAQALPQEQHFSQQQTVKTVQAGEEWTVADIRQTQTQFEVYDHLPKLFRLYQTLNPSPVLASFAFLLQWPQLSPAEQQQKYSQFACHELNLFLYQHDPAFFQRVIQPYLQQKLHKTFMDHWLLGDDLSAYQPHSAAFQRLNVLEQILLAQRIPRLQPAIRRAIREQWELVVPNRAQLKQQFTQALKVNALQATVPATASEGEDDEAQPDAPKEMVEEMVADQIALAKTETAAAGLEAAMEPAPAPAPALAMIRSPDFAARDKAADGRDGRIAKKGQVEVERKQKAMPKPRPLYQKPDKTQEWAENNYYQVPDATAFAPNWIAVNAFWHDYAQAEDPRHFMSAHWASANTHPNEILLALAVMDLPWTAPAPAIQYHHAGLKAQWSAPAIVYQQQIQPAAYEESPILVSQRFFRADDRYRLDERQRQQEHFVQGEFLPQVIYGAQVVITNPSALEQEVEVLLQIPQGAIAVNQSPAIQSVPLQLGAYRTEVLYYYFYFSQTGQYAHYPAQVTQPGKVIAFATPPATFQVVAQLRTQDQTSWAYISQQGSLQQVLTYLEQHNLHSLDLEKIAFRMQERNAFTAILSLLSSLNYYHPVLWSYALKHNDTTRLQEYLVHATALTTRVGLYFNSPLLTINPVMQGLYQQLEYEPLINARAHPLGVRRQILNDRFYQQYHQWLALLSYKTQINTEERLMTIYYLLLQDRIEEASALFKTIHASSVTTVLQYDYLSAYLAWSQGDLAMVKRLAVRYQDYPVPVWQQRFANMLAQWDEVQGQSARVSNPDRLEQQQALLATQTPSFSVILDTQGQMQIQYQQLSEIQVNYYEMDLELLFSNNPFLYQNSHEQLLIQPNASIVLTLDPKQSVYQTKIPPELAHRNLMIEWVADGKRQTKTYYAHSLPAQFSEAYGQLQVYTADQQPLAKAYVKVYAQYKNGQVQFYKDGYTDWRGRFDYASLSTDDLDQVARFAILILSPEQGSLVREVESPRQ